MRDKTKYFMNAFIFAGIAMHFAGCSTVPISERKQFMISDLANENAKATTTYAQIIKTDKLSQEQKQQDLINRVGKAVRDAAGEIDFVWDFNVIQGKNANAFCLQSGKTAVNTAMMRRFSNEAELAAVVAHQVAHTIARHDGERMSWCYLRVVGTLGISLFFNDLPHLLNGAGSKYSITLPYNQTCEKEADLIGIRLMAKAGYDPRAAIDFLKKTSEKASSMNVYVTTHPCDSERIAALELALDEAMNIYQESPNKKGFGVKMKDGLPE